MRLFMTVVMVAMLTGQAAARDVYVDNLAGNDTLLGREPLGGGREDGPVRTIAKATRLAQSGDRIVLANTGEPYREQVTLQGGKCSGFGTGSPFVLEGNGAVIDGTTDVPDEAWQRVGADAFRFGPLLKSHQTLFIDEEPVGRVPAQRGEALPSLQPMQWLLSGGWVYLRSRPGEVPQSYHLRCAGLQTGITVYDVQNLVIRNVTVRGFALDGVNIHDKGFNVRLEGVVTKDNGRSGLSIGGASRARLIGCEAAGNHVAQVRTEGYCRVQHTECVLDEATAPAIMRQGGEIEEE
jgi:hypothetical protein